MNTIYHVHFGFGQEVWFMDATFKPMNFNVTTIYFDKDRECILYGKDMVALPAGRLYHTRDAAIRSVIAKCEDLLAQTTEANHE